VTTPKKLPVPVGPTLRDAWAMRVAYVGSILITGTVMVTAGIMGAHVYRWEVLAWGVTTLGWVFAWSYQVSASLYWRTSCLLAEETIYTVPRVILLEDKPEDIEKGQ
jgi:hypothetical protein